MKQQAVLVVAPPYAYPPRTGGCVRTCNFIQALATRFYVDVLIVAGDYPLPLPVNPTVRNHYFHTLRDVGLYALSGKRYPNLSRIDQYVLGLLPHTTSAHGEGLTNTLRILQESFQYTAHVHRYSYHLFGEPRDRTHRVIVDIDDSPFEAEPPSPQSHLRSGPSTLLRFLKKAIQRRHKDYFLRKIESLYISHSDYLLVVSRKDIQASLSHKTGVLPNSFLIQGPPRTRQPNSPHITVASSTSTIQAPPSSPQHLTLGFIGSPHPPNREGLNHFLHAIWPSLSARFPDLSLLIAGSGGVAVSSQSGGAIPPSERISMLGFVEDIADFYQAIDIAIAPISSGAGSNIKVVEALGQGVPVIGTDFALRAAYEVGCEHHVRIAHTAEDWIAILSDHQQIQDLIRTCQSTDLARQISEGWQQKLLQQVAGEGL